MNVLQLCKYYSPDVGGIELVEKTITKAHNDLTDKVVIVAFADAEDEVRGEFEEIVYRIRQDLFLLSAPFNFSFIFEFKSMVIKHKVDRVYVHLPNPFMHEVLRQSKSFLEKMNIEVVAVYHSDIVNQKFLGKIYDYYFNLTKGFYSKWICSSRKLWESSTILRNIDSKKQRIIPFCTEGNLAFKKRENFGGKLLAVGRHVPYKGFEFLIKAINKTRYELHIIGNGPLYERLKSIAGPNVFLHRGISECEKNDLFNECDLLVVSSINRAEAYGMIIVEAFETGMPVIASNLDSGVTFLVQNENTGLVFDVKNEDQLIKAIERIEEDSKLYSTLADNAYSFFKSELSYEKFRDKIKEL